MTEIHCYAEDCKYCNSNNNVCEADAVCIESGFSPNCDTYEPEDEEEQA